MHAIGRNQGLLQRSLPPRRGLRVVEDARRNQEDEAEDRDAHDVVLPASPLVGPVPNLLGECEEVHCSTSLAALGRSSDTTWPSRMCTIRSATAAASGLCVIITIVW